ncbi:uncharacterized protein CANTADRAFT_44412 [Suhomyces tanzawaensis NRRL Y-17324]|uniref:Uncharacterized protein n=1 Tax=Suhomyces tanzawaensis NRRL Y-17324 TaxID=984487 RepID=A0A1E4SQ03_9ASCO|nr:uncharacterized protein CANTADRAFT_44412 [Suhomyces tanzawaensis NRRL Y-17324]ODV81594.1 hypothetical protein CANTADRAFT_44412 [Suhomyces tanzawaensis NRRL Y-17324]
MSMKPRPTPPFINRLIVGTIATIAGIYVIKDAGKDFEWIKFEPHSPDEIERRRKEGVGMKMKTLETRTLDYTPEAKERLKKLVEENQKDD